MKRNVGLLIGCLILGAATVARAHCGHCGKGDVAESVEAKKEMVAGHLDKLTEKLQLTEDQKGKVQAILEEKKQRMEQIRRETHEKIKAVLTDEQKAKFDEVKKDCCPPGGECPKCALKGHEHHGSKKHKK